MSYLEGIALVMSWLPIGRPTKVLHKKLKKSNQGQDLGIWGQDLGNPKLSGTLNTERGNLNIHLKGSIAMDDFLEWLVGPGGQRSERALFEVMDSLKNCSVQPSQKKIVWDDGQRLSITETARRIHLQSDLPLLEIESHLIGWLEMHYEPEGLNEQQMEQFENMIDVWIHEHLHSRKPE